MGQPIILNLNQINILHKLGRAYGSALTFENISVTSNGTRCDWKASSSAWEKINNASDAGCIDLEASREDLISYLDWFDRQEIDEVERRSLFGVYRPRTEQEKALFMFLKLAQAFNYPQDVKKNEENT